MMSLLWLFLVGWAGWQISRPLMGDPAMMQLHPAGLAAAPRLLLRLSSAIWLGILPITWFTYLVAALLAPVLPPSIHPLLIANSLVMIGLAAWLMIVMVHRTRSGPCAKTDLNKASSPTGCSSVIHRSNLFERSSLFQRSSLFYLAVLLIWLVFATWLMTSTFYQEGRFIHAGFSVFSDFAPHTALVSSFSSGQNWPTQYPHFANDGISYHFMFFFLCGNLNYLGLSLAWSINLPSIIGMVTFCLLLGSLAQLLTGKRLTFLLAPLMMFARSSMAFWTWLKDLADLKDIPLSLSAIWQAMLEQSSFIGHTLHDDWGLWGVNVYANQRHFLPGLSLVLIVLFLLLPDLQSGLQIEHRWRGWFRPEVWLPGDAWAWRRLLGSLMLVCLMPYWHGSALVGLLLMLMPMAVFARNRLSFLLTGLAAAGSALLQSSFFTGEATRVVQPSLVFGFLADPRTPVGVLAYLLELTGLALPMLFIAFWLPGWRRKVLISGFCLPLIFAFTVSLTPDVTVNHKMVMMTLAFANIFLADLLLRLAGWTGIQLRQIPSMTDRLPWYRILLRSGRILAALVLSIILLITGIEEVIIVRNINQNSVALNLDSPLTNWIRQNTATDAIFVAAPYHYHAFFLAGRSLWLGHAYYAWSAGHDTAGRWDDQAWLLAGGYGDVDGVQAMLERESLDYLILDNDLRQRDDIVVDESFFTEHFPMVAEFPDLGDTKIYALR